MTRDPQLWPNEPVRPPEGWPTCPDCHGKAPGWPSLCKRCNGRGVITDGSPEL